MMCAKNLKNRKVQKKSIVLLCRVSSTIVTCAVTKVELNSGDRNVNPVHSNKPTVDCACIV